MVNIVYKNALTETLEYLKGIRQEDIDKIPTSFMKYLEENCSKEYECNFDYTKPLKELNLLPETKGIIGLICLKYWCEDETQKKLFLKSLNENEIKYQEELRIRYNPDNLFNGKQKINDNQTKNEQVAMVEYKENIFVKFLNKLKKLIMRKGKNKYND